MLLLELPPDQLEMVAGFLCACEYARFSLAARACRDRQPPRQPRSFASVASVTFALRHPSHPSHREGGRCKKGRVSLDLTRYALAGQDERGEQGLGEAEVRWVAAQLALAVGALHSIGMLHRDIKPSNAILSRDGCARDAARPTCPAL